MCLICVYAFLDVVSHKRGDSDGNSNTNDAYDGIIVILFSWVEKNQILKILGILSELELLKRCSNFYLLW